ncbi:MAG: SLBB domain-containing protein [Acidobacteriota bacterium]
MKLYFLFAIIISFFLYCAIPAQNMPAAPEPSKGYMLWPGDELTGKVLGEPEFDFVATVNEDGKIELPFSDKAVVARCKTEKEVRTDITELLGKYLRSPQLNLRITDRKGRPPATISGEVNAPTQVTLMRKATLLELLSVAGGTKEEAGGTVQVFRTQPPLCAAPGEDADWKDTASNGSDVPSRLYKISDVKLGRDESNPIIYPGDVIVVQKASPVYITGEVVAPQGIYLKDDGLTLTEAIAKLGGVRREAKTKDIKIFRLKENSKDREVISANYDLIKKGTQKDLVLQPYDIVQVDTAKDSIAQAILKIAVGAGKGMVGSMSSGLSYRVLY